MGSFWFPQGWPLFDLYSKPPFRSFNPTSWGYPRWVAHYWWIFILHYQYRVI